MRTDFSIRSLAPRLFAIALLIAAPPGYCASAASKSLDAEASCAEIRGAIRDLATAEKNEAFALHLMQPGDPSPMAEARFVVFEDRLGKLREVLRHVRHSADLADQQVGECISLGFGSLAQGEQLDSELEEFVLRRDGQALNDAVGIRPLEPSAREPLQQRPEHAE